MAVEQEAIGSGVDPSVRKLRRWLRLEQVAFLLLIGTAVAYQFGLFHSGPEVCVIAIDGHPATVVDSPRVAKRLLDGIKQSAEDPRTAEFAQKVTLYRVSAAGNPPVSEVAALGVLSSRLTVVTPGVGVYANGRLVFGLPTRQDAVDALSLLLRDLSPADPDLTRAFREQVRVREAQVPVSKYLRLPRAVLDLAHQAMAVKGSYTVRGGDTAWKIATHHKVSLQQLARANPGLNFGRLRVGDAVVLPGGGPPLTVVAWKEVTEPVGDPSRNLLQTVRITYENGAKVQQDVVRRPPRREASTDRRRRSGRHYRRSRDESTWNQADGTALGDQTVRQPRHSRRRHVPSAGAEGPGATAPDTTTPAEPG